MYIHIIYILFTGIYRMYIYILYYWISNLSFSLDNFESSILVFFFSLRIPLKIHLILKGSRLSKITYLEKMKNNIKWSYNL